VSDATNTNRRWLEFGAVLLASLAMASYVHWGLNRFPLAEGLMLFYFPAWLGVNAVFGGIHGAPAWSEIPSVAIAFIVQNVVLWYGAKWFVNLFPRKIGGT
jgi:hypothetical protein